MFSYTQLLVSVSDSGFIWRLLCVVYVYCLCILCYRINDNQARNSVVIICREEHSARSVVTFSYGISMLN